MTETITVVNLKGGTGKSTTAAMLAHAYASAGRRPLVVDADPQASLVRWGEAGGWQFPAVGLPVRNLHSRLAGIAGPAFDVIVIDTPPLEEQAGIVHGALRAATTVIVPMAPTMIEFERLGAVWDAIDDIDSLREAPVDSAVLLNRVVPRAKSTSVFRQLIEDAGHRVLSAVVPRREAIAQAFGARISDAGPYNDVVAELTAERNPNR